MLTQNVRVIVLDDESAQRAPQPPKGGSPSQGDFLGQAQMDWLFNTVLTTPVTLNLMICGKSYPGELTDGVVEGQDVDKPCAYPTWRSGFGSGIAAAQAQGQGFVYLGGDRHADGYMPKENNAHGGFACLVGSGWSQHSLTPMLGEGNDFAILYTGFDAGDDLGPQVMQYLRGVLTDNGPDDVTFMVEMRYLKPPAPSPTPVPRWQWQMDTLATVTLHFPET